MSPSELDLYDTLESEPFQFRLVQIRTSEDNSNRHLPIHINLKTFTLEDAPKYRCLSYVWGLDERHPITVNDHEVLITKNLLGFLQVMRFKSRDPEGWLWIDAICINQSNPAERSQQVQRMRNIYSKADQVIAWLGWEWDRLGDASDSGRNESAECSAAVRCDEGNFCEHTKERPSEHAIEYILDLAKGFRAWTNEGNDPWMQLGQYSFDDPAVHTMLDVRHAPMKLWAAVAVFLHRAWFQRVWIVQEAALAKSLVLVCGQKVFMWDEVVQVSIFLHASGWFQRLIPYVSGKRDAANPPGWHVLFLTALQHFTGGEELPAGVGDMFDQRGFHGAESDVDRLDWLIKKTTPFHATDPRDHLFAPLSLLAQPLPANGYTSLVAEVYTEQTGNLLAGSKDLSLLSLAELHQDPDARDWIANLPSWVPDYTIAERSLLQDIPNRECNAVPDRPKKCAWTPGSKTIELEGTVLDTIDSISRPLESILSSKDLRPLIGFCLTLPTTLPNGQERAEAFWQTLIGGLPINQTAAPTAAGFKLYLQLSTAIYLHGNEMNPSLQPHTDWSAWWCFDTLHNSSAAAAECTPSVRELQEYAEHWRSIMIAGFSRVEEATQTEPATTFGLSLGRVYPGRCLFRSPKGFIGLAPTQMRKGDEICFLSGSKMPFLLRRYAEEVAYSVVGECYVHGYMNGRIVEEKAEEGWIRVVLK